MKFIADSMLGTLAKWLRILGYDTLFDPALDDHQLVRLARAENRLLLTRDRQLAQRRGVSVLLLGSENLDDQIRQVLAGAEVETGQTFSRCPICNEPLVDLDPREAGARLPSYLIRSQATFRACPGCNRLYWRGTHWSAMQARLNRLLSTDRETPSRDAPGPNSL